MDKKIVIPPEHAEKAIAFFKRLSDLTDLAKKRAEERMKKHKEEILKRIAEQNQPK